MAILSPKSIRLDLKPPITTLDIVNKLNEINLSYGCSVDRIQKALDILKIIKEKERESNYERYF